VNKIPVVFEDEVLLAVNKPAGLPIHPTVDRIRANLHQVVEMQTGLKLVLFHRLDLDTTGVVLFGKDPSINRTMTEKFIERDIKKNYWAVVDGRWPEHVSEIRTYIDKASGGRWRNVPRGRGGKSAHSQFKVLASNGEKSWIVVTPLTGRTHQIRLHCLEAHHPVMGDKFYGKAHPQGVPMALHARELSFAHPLTQKPVAITAEPPDYWASIWLKGLKT
jgi:RluA family pseudouridine synthase